jgi:endonuclease/exonuclease/phosphatase family metal-dependent hydrolase
MRVCSYNIHKGIGGRDRLYRPERVLEAITSEEADIVCLQEVDRNVRRSRFDDQPVLIQEALGFDHSAFQFNHRVGRGGYGNLIVSRWPIVYRHNISLRIKGKKNRRAQLVVIDTPEGELRLVNWHLGLSESERLWQVDRLLGHDSFRRLKGRPTLITGDSNDWRNTLEQAAFSGRGLMQITAPPLEYKSFPAYMPLGALDKAFGCGRLALDRANIIRSKLTRKASDHLPLVIDFTFHRGTGAISKTLE